MGLFILVYFSAVLWVRYCRELHKRGAPSIFGATPMVRSGPPISVYSGPVVTVVANLMSLFGAMRAGAVHPCEEEANPEDPV